MPCILHSRRKEFSTQYSIAKLIICSLKIGSFTLLSPLQLFATLQRLDLLPAWPLLPSPFRLDFFTPLLPQLPSAWTRASTATFFSKLATSPFITFLCMFYFTDVVKSKLCSYSRAALPRPDNPDRASFRFEIDNEASGTAPVLDYPRLQGSLWEELQKDIENFVGKLRLLHQKVANGLGCLPIGRQSSVTFPKSECTAAEISTANDAESLQLRERESADSQPVRSSESVQVASTGMTAPPGSSTVSSTSPLLTPTSSEDPEESLGEPSNVRIRTRTGSTSTLHMDVEFNAAERGGPVVTSSFAASPRPAAVETIVSQASARECLHIISSCL